MSNAEQSSNYPLFDRSFLPPARFEFVVVGDTHFILDPEPYAVEFHSVREWPQRAEWAITQIAALKTDFVIHLGDLTEENSAHPQQAEARKQALEQFSRHRMRLYHVAGNMDIGDKPDATMWSAWVTPDSLDRFHSRLGRSWYSFDHRGVHFVVLNSQIMDGPLPEASEQTTWLEEDLSANEGQRIFMFMHMPPFFVEESEPDFGFYNSINQPARGWITRLLRRYQVEMLFTGHTHFRAFHRVNATRFYVSPSTTTSRAGFYEAFHVAPPPEQGRNDKPKVGFYLVRVYEKGAGVHFIRTHGETSPPQTEAGWQHLICQNTPGLAGSPGGVYLRNPLATLSAGALAWPSVLRQRVRDDHPFLAILEAGIRHVRVPVADLDDDVQRERLQMLRDEGVQVTATWIWSANLDLPAAVSARNHHCDAIELQVPGGIIPHQVSLEALAVCRERARKPVVLTPILAMEPKPGKYHPRTRFGYLVDEVVELDARLAELEMDVDRIICHVGPETGPWTTLDAFRRLPRLARIRGLDYVVGLAAVQEHLDAQRAAEALFAAALQPDCRLFLDPLVDLDRTNDVYHGLLDRLSNPHPAYYTVQTLNTILFGEPQTFEPLPVASNASNRIFGLTNAQRRRWLILSPGDADVAALEGILTEPGNQTVMDLTNGLSREVSNGDELRQVLIEVRGPALVLSPQASS